jgi:hypothetical protein
MRNRFLLGAGVALAVAFGGTQAHAQLGWLPWNQTGCRVPGISDPRAGGHRPGPNGYDKRRIVSTVPGQSSLAPEALSHSEFR